MAVGVYAGVAAMTDRDVSDSVAVGVAVLLAWMAARELDPDRQIVAIWAMPIAFAASLYVVPSLVVTAVAALAVRLVAGTIGAPITALDIVILGGLGFLSGVEIAAWIAALAIGMWLLSAQEVGKLKWIGLASLAGGMAIGFLVADVEQIAIGEDAYLLAAVGGAVMMLAMTPKNVESETDARTGTVDAKRIGLARKAAGSFIMWAAVMAGVAGFWMVSPILAALAATAVAKWFLPGA
ncbi:MAG: hypothetical protein ACC645_26495 [Pirellulales bacterium]